MSTLVTRNSQPFLSIEFEARTLRAVMRDELSVAQQLELRLAIEKAARRIVRNDAARQPFPSFKSTLARMLGWPGQRTQKAGPSGFATEQDAEELYEDLSGLVGFLRDELHQDYLRAVQMVDELDRVSHKHKLYRMPIEPLPSPTEVTDIGQLTS